MSRETVSGEALFILRNLRENHRAGRSNRLAEVKAALEPSVSLEFDRYFFFLRKFHYIAMDPRDAQLRLTDQGERIVDGASLDRFATEVGEFFAEQLLPVETTAQTQAMDVAGLPAVMPPPPPKEDDLTPPPHELLSEDVPLEGEPLTEEPPAQPFQFDDAAAAAEPAPSMERTPIGGSGPVVGRASAARVPPAVAPAPAPSPRRPSPPERAAPARPAPAATAPSNGSAAPTAAAAIASPLHAAPANVSSTDGERYQRFDPIGNGPLGTVFKGRHNALGIDVAIKELKDIFGYFSFLQRGDVLKRLRKELCAQAAVNHPGVVRVIDQSVETARPFFVTELCRGSLREKVDQSGGRGLPVAQALRLFLQIVYGLRAAHQAGLLHHDLKPENVLLDAYGNAKLSDFGMTRVIEVDASKGLPHVFVGTGGMPYLAPELLHRAKDAGPSADVYACGILLYEMLTGQIPGRRSPMPSEVNAEIPSKLDPLFDKMTQDRREHRYADFDAVLADFYGAFSEGEFLTRGDLISWSI